MPPGSRPTGSLLGRCTCGAALALAAAAPAPAAPQFVHLSVEHGLSQGTVGAVLQDHLGFIWLGTEEGLNRYDGYGFTVFRHDPGDAESLPDDLVAALYEDSRRVLWIGTGRGLAYFDRAREAFVRVPAIRERAGAILEDAVGNLWVAAAGDGLFERRAGETTFRLHGPGAGDPSSLAGHQVSRLLLDRRGRMWVGMRDAGVDMLENPADPGRGQPGAPEGFVHFRHDPRNPGSLGHDEVWGLAEDAGGGIWVATYGGGLDWIDPETRMVRHHRQRPSEPDGLPTDLLTDVLVDRSGTLWIGTNGAGVLRFDPAARSFRSLRHDPADPGSLSHDVVRRLYEDHHGQLWVGAYLRGANVLQQERAFRFFTHSETNPSSLSDPEVGSFLEDREGRLWVGTIWGWLNRYQRRTGTFVRYRFPSSEVRASCILALHQDRRGRIWAGTYRAGLGHFDPRNGTFKIYRPGEPSSVLPQIWAIAGEDDGTLWLGTGSGVARFDPDRGRVIEHLPTFTPQGLSHSDVRALLRDREGNLWVGCLGGLDVRLRGGAGYIHYTHDDKDPHSLSHNAVVALHEDREGLLWVGTLGGGLNRLDPESGRFTSYRSFPSSVIWGIQEDSSGRLWLSTNRGLSRFDPDSGRIDNFDVTNGLQSLQGTLGATLRTRDGHLLFGTADGFYDFDPDAIELDSRSPRVEFTFLRLLADPAPPPLPLAVTRRVELQSGDDAFAVEFAAMDHAIPRRNLYAYRMEGFSDDWIQIGARREVTFTNLDSGSYVLHVKASSSDGAWSEAPVASLSIEVPGGWIALWWLGGLGAAVIGIAALLRRRR